MRRSRAMVLVAAVALAALTARLGLWQLDRAAQKRALEAADLERRSLPPLVQGSELPRRADEARSVHQRAVVVQGHWRDDLTVFLDNRPMARRVGFVVVTPLTLQDGTAVLVQRGWLPRDAADRTRVAAPPAGHGQVRITGRMAPPPSQIYDFAGAAPGPIRQNLDLDGFAVESRLLLRPFSVLQTEPADGGPADGLQRDWPQVPADVHKHYGYAFQWFSLSALTVFLYVWFQIIRPRSQRRSP